MTFVDSLDSIFILHAYILPTDPSLYASGPDKRRWWRRFRWFEASSSKVDAEVGDVTDAEEQAGRLPRGDQGRVLGITIVLTVLSIVVAFLISFVSAASEYGPREVKTRLTSNTLHRHNLWGELVSCRRATDGDHTTRLTSV